MWTQAIMMGYYKAEITGPFASNETHFFHVNKKRQEFTNPVWRAMRPKEGGLNLNLFQYLHKVSLIAGVNNN